MRGGGPPTEHPGRSNPEAIGCGGHAAHPSSPLSRRPPGYDPDRCSVIGSYHVAKPPFPHGAHRDPVMPPDPLLPAGAGRRRPVSARRDKLDSSYLAGPCAAATHVEGLRLRTAEHIRHSKSEATL
jgi:hypothetical protein